MSEVYSLDKLIMDFKVDCHFVKGLYQMFSRGYGYSTLVEIDHWTSYKVGSFRENFTVKLDNAESFFIASEPNWVKPSEYSTYVRMEFNPNKVGESFAFQLLHGLLVHNAKFIDFIRFDLAIDINVDRRDIWLKKDNRTYKVFQNSESDKTEYLGQRSQHGQVKLYNKQMEAKLSYPLTRLELTIDYENSSSEEFKRIFPKVTYIDTGQMMLDDEKIDGTVRVLVLACLQNPEYIKMLARKMGKKIECILERYTQQVKPDLVNYRNILSEILKYGKSENYYDLMTRYRNYISDEVFFPFN